MFFITKGEDRMGQVFSVILLVAICLHLGGKPDWAGVFSLIAVAIAVLGMIIGNRIKGRKRV